MEPASSAQQQPRLFSLQIEGDVNGGGGRGRYVNTISSNFVEYNRLERLGMDDGLSSGDASNDGEDRELDDALSDCESGISGPNNEESPGPFGNDLERVGEEDKLHEIISKRFISGLGFMGNQASVVGLHRNICSNSIGQARFQSFQIFTRAMQKKCSGSPNAKFAWFGGSKHTLIKIITNGFSHSELDLTDGQGYGRGVHLIHDSSSIDCLSSSSPDEEDGVRHVLLCRVLLGKTEAIHPGSQQCYPSSDEFDSGVDNLLKPRKYIVWSCNMNTRIFPEYILSFKIPSHSSSPSPNGNQRNGRALRMPSSPWVPFTGLIPALSKILPPHIMEMLSKHYNDHREKKITRDELIQTIRRVTGDKLLTELIRSYRNKQQNRMSATDSLKTSSPNCTDRMMT